MKERPILMSGPNIQPILEGRKTQTRRISKKHQLGGRRYFFDVDRSLPRTDVICPYGKPGDRLWVREAWRVPKMHDHLPPRDLPRDTRIWYVADGDDPNMIKRGRYRHARFMPRWESRILLEIIEVRVERLQDISEEDAKAEGCAAIEGYMWHTFEEADQGIPMHAHTAKDAYGALWESINGPGSWDANPWVWVISFQRTEQK